VLKITKIEKSEPTQSHSEGSNFFTILVEFEYDTEDSEYAFRQLGKYYKGTVLIDREKYEEHYRTLDKDDISFEKIPGTTFSQLKSKRLNPYEAGYCQTMDIVGEDNIVEFAKNKFRYSCHVSSNYITDGAAKQLQEMKEHIDNNFCRYGNYPSQVGAFRSGDTFSDCMGIIETLDRFWD
jgi:hypothetical protein